MPNDTLDTPIAPSLSFEILPQSLIVSRDLPVLLDFYVPILGARAVMVYLLLAHEEQGKTLSHASFYTRTRLTQTEFEAALDSLSAIGLIKVYRKEKGSLPGADLIYVLYAPESPSAFMGNTLLAGLLQRNLDSTERGALKERYAAKPLPSEGYTDVSRKAFEVFDLDNVFLDKREKGFISTKRAIPSMPWSEEAFRASLSEECPDLSYETLSKKERETIQELASLYAFSEETMASLIARIHMPGDAYLDLNALRLEAKEESKNGLGYLRVEERRGRDTSLSGESGIAKMIRRMENLSPVEFLTNLQKGRKPVASDLALLTQLEYENGLSRPLINALIFYVTQTKNGQLPKSYVTTVAGSLLRSNAITALDAYNFLWSNHYGGEGKKRGASTSYNKKNVVETSPKPIANPTPKPAKTSSDEEDYDFDKLMEEGEDDK